MPKPPTTDDFHSPVHDTRVAARLGVWLGIAFGICFLTGVVSHVQQHPLGGLAVSPGPAWGYRVTQGIHVFTGIASVPLLLAKVYAAYPRLFERPVLGSPLRLLERGSIGVLVASAFLQVVTGVFNIGQWYVFGFGFTAAHWAFAWVSIGALMVHVAVKLPVVRQALAQPIAREPGPERDRRWFLRGALGVAAGAVALTVGQAVPALEPVAVLAKRHPRRSPLGVPVNRTAAAAGVGGDVDEAAWTIQLVGPGGSKDLVWDELRAMPQTQVELPIACVEGWSVTARWSGVRVRDLVGLAGAGPGAMVHVESAERHGAYRRTTLPAAHAAHPDTLLALTINGRRLSPDHGFPARIIAPGRPGVLQTKWIQRLEVVG